MTPRVIGVKLQAVPGPFAEVYLQGVVVRVPFSGCVAGADALGIRIGLEVIDRISCARSSEADIVRARAKRRADQVADVRHGATDTCQSAGHSSSLTRLQIRDEVACGIIGQRCPRSAGCLPGRRSIEYWHCLLSGESVICEAARWLARLATRRIRVNVRSQVSLRVLELREEAVWELRSGPENVDFVGIDIYPLARVVAHDVPHFKRAALPDLPLNANIPRLRVGLLNLWIHAVQPRATLESEI